MRAWTAFLPLIIGLTGCAQNFDHTVAAVECGDVQIEVIERYRQAAKSGHTGASRHVLRANLGLAASSKEIDITPVDTVDLSAVERKLEDTERWRLLAKHERASRRVIVSPERLTPDEFEVVSSCVEQHAGRINERLAEPREPIELFESETSRRRWAGLHSISYQRGAWGRQPCEQGHVGVFHFSCDEVPYFLSLDGHGYVWLCSQADPSSVCSRALARVDASGSTAAARPPDFRARCTQNGLSEWLDQDPLRMHRECKLPSGDSPSSLFELTESETLEPRGR